jgi:hypothetical protein
LQKTFFISEPQRQRGLPLSSEREFGESSITSISERHAGFWQINLGFLRTPNLPEIMNRGYLRARMMQPRVDDTPLNEDV